MLLKTFSPATMDVSSSFSASSIYLAKRQTLLRRTLFPSIEPCVQRKKHCKLHLVCLYQPSHGSKATRKELLLNLTKTVSAGVKHSPGPVEVSGSPCTHLSYCFFLLCISQDVPHAFL